MKVPKRRPPSPHSCNRSRSPLRQWAATKPSQVMNANRSTKTINAIQFTSRTRLPPERFARAWTAGLRLGGEVDDRGQDRADDHPKKLIPVEERHAAKGRLYLVVEGRPDDRGELDDEQQVPPAPTILSAWPSVHGSSLRRKAEQQVPTCSAHLCFNHWA